MSITYELNKKYDGIEIKFSEKPTAQVLSRLKELGFKWHPGKGVWYAKNTDVRLEFAKSIMNEKTYKQMSLFNMDEVKEEPKKKAEPKKAEPKKTVQKKAETKKSEVKPKAEQKKDSEKPKIQKSDNIIELAKARPDIKVRMDLSESHTIEECIEKINKEKAIFKDSDSTFVLDGILEMCKVNPNFRNNFMREEKTFSGAFQYFMDLARKGYAHKFNNVAYMDNNLALGFAMDYYNMVD